MSVLLQINSGRYPFAKPYDSTSGLTGEEQQVLFWICLAIVIYVFLRVRKSLKKK